MYLPNLKIKTETKQDGYRILSPNLLNIQSFQIHQNLFSYTDSLISIE